jgi:catechol-2,3-dioxygenase
MPSKLRIFETILYADDLVAAETFYREVLGLKTLQTRELFITLQCDPGYLLIFDRRKSEQEGRPVPSHGATGPGHIAFAVEAADLDGWREHLKSSNVPIEDEVDWETGGRSIYFRDPAGNSLELAPPELWKPGA